MQGSATGQEIASSTSVSESATYEALNEMADRGLLINREDNWQLSGTGQLVAETGRQCERLNETIAADADYWQNHDLSGLARRFRRKMYRLADAEILRAPETDPHQVSRRVEQAIRAANEVSIATPVYNSRHADALLNSSGSPHRIIFDPSVMEQLLRDNPEGPDKAGIADVGIRVQPVGVALTVTDTELLLSLPRLGGSYDPGTEVIAESEPAVSFGREVFEKYWRDGMPIKEWINIECPGLADRAGIDS
jgi:predicted transcriptional regulator